MREHLDEGNLSALRKESSLSAGAQGAGKAGRRGLPQELRGAGGVVQGSRGLRGQGLPTSPGVRGRGPELKVLWSGGRGQADGKAGWREDHGREGL